MPTLKPTTEVQLTLQMKEWQAIINALTQFVPMLRVDLESKGLAWASQQLAKEMERALTRLGY